MYYTEPWKWLDLGVISNHLESYFVFVTIVCWVLYDQTQLTFFNIFYWLAQGLSHQGAPGSSQLGGAEFACRWYVSVCLVVFSGCTSFQRWYLSWCRKVSVKMPQLKAAPNSDTSDSDRLGCDIGRHIIEHSFQLLLVEPSLQTVHTLCLKKKNSDIKNFICNQRGERRAILNTKNIKICGWLTNLEAVKMEFVCIVFRLWWISAESWSFWFPKVV